MRGMGVMHASGYRWWPARQLHQRGVERENSASVLIAFAYKERPLFSGSKKASAAHDGRRLDDQTSAGRHGVATPFARH
jgi:hypothetical protein